MHFDRAADWVLGLRKGESVSVLSWRGEDEALRGPGPGHSTVYAQSSPVVSEDNNAAAALLGVMFTCCGGAIAFGSARAGFERAARFYRAHPRLHDFVVAELTVIACTAMVSALLVGQGDVSAGMLTPAVAIPAATVVALLVLRTVLRRDLLKSPRSAAGVGATGALPAGLPPDLE